jgi:hypothetical protein
MSIKVPEGLLLPAGPVHKPLDSVLQVNNIEVYKQAEGFATEFEVGNHLSMVKFPCLKGFLREPSRPSWLCSTDCFAMWLLIYSQRQLPVSSGHMPGMDPGNTCQQRTGNGGDSRSSAQRPRPGTAREHM